MVWKYNGDSAYWVDEFEEPGEWVGGGGDAPGFFVPDIPVVYEGGGGDAVGWQIPLTPDYIASIQNQPEPPAPSWLAPEDYAASGFTPTGISVSTGALPTNAQGSAVPVAPVSQLSTNPDPTQPFNFAPNPLVSNANPFAKPINNAIQSYLGRPANALELSQYSTMLAKNPDDYGLIVNKIQNSEEAAKAILQGKQKLIIDPRKGDMTNIWLGADYALWKPSEESGLSSITNAIGGAIPFAALAAMTGGAGAAAGLGSIGAGALAGGVSNAARAAIEGGNIGTSALTGALTGALGAGALNALSASPSLQFGPTYSELGYSPQFGPTYSDLGYTPQFGPSYAELSYSPPLGNQSLSTFTQNNMVGPFDQMQPGDVQVSSIDPNSYFIKNPNGTLSAVTPTGTIQVPVGSENQILAQASEVLPIDWTKGDQYIADASARAADIQRSTQPIPLGTPNEPYGSGRFLGMDQPRDVLGANANEAFMQQIGTDPSNNYNAGIPQGSTFSENPATGKFDIPQEFALPEVNVNSSGTGSIGLGTSYFAGNETYIPQTDGTYTVYDNITGNYSTAASLPSNALPLAQPNTSLLFGFNPLTSLSSLVSSLTGGTKPGNVPGTGTGTGTGTNGDGTGDGGGNGTGDGGGGPGTGPGKVPTAPPFKFPTIPLPKAVVPTAATSSFYAPKGQVDYRPIIDLLGPRQILRNLF